MAFEAFIDQDKGPPDFTNEAGFEFRAERGLTKYARNKLGGEYVVWLVSGGDLKHPEYLLTEGQKEMHASSKYEDIACHIDFLKLAKEDK